MYTLTTQAHSILLPMTHSNLLAIHSNYKYKQISKEECLQSESSDSSNSASIESALKYINNKVKTCIQHSEKNANPIHESVTTSRGIKNVINIDEKS